ncbi:Uncharacterised protein [uncultured archaeon]|nr:Uncharacterised protein [uncultured archaeon]
MIRGKIIFWIAAIAIVSSLISGCVSTPPATPVVTPVMTPTPTATLTPMTTPAPTPATSVVVLTAPTTAIASQSFMVSWRVNPTQVTIPYTAVYYGPDSKSEPLSLTSYPGKTDVLNGTTPADFSANITIGKTGIFYFRAYAMIDGTNYWSDERTINITAPTIVSIKITPAATATTSGGGVFGY